MCIKDLVVVVCVALLGTSGIAVADFGVDITIYDGNSSTTTGWNGENEDQEVEPGNVRDQVWDLEGFAMTDDSILSMLGGYDFVNGRSGYDSGDIFIDIDGDVGIGDSLPHGGNGVVSILSSDLDHGYEYVLDLNFDSMSYDIIELTDDSWLSVYYGQNDASNPWRYDSGANVPLNSGTIGYQTGLSDAETGFLGGSHNAASFDVSFLDGSSRGKSSLSHFASVG
jgi:hypothetical protein